MPFLHDIRCLSLCLIPSKVGRFCYDRPLSIACISFFSVLRSSLPYGIFEQLWRRHKYSKHSYYDTSFGYVNTMPFLVGYNDSLFENYCILSYNLIL